jgi:hypothetical protein
MHYGPGDISRGKIARLAVGSQASRLTMYYRQAGRLSSGVTGSAGFIAPNSIRI